MRLVEGLSGRDFRGAIRTLGHGRQLGRMRLGFRRKVATDFCFVTAFEARARQVIVHMLPSTGVSL